MRGRANGDLDAESIGVFDPSPLLLDALIATIADAGFVASRANDPLTWAHQHRTALLVVGVTRTRHLEAAAHMR